MVQNRPIDKKIYRDSVLRRTQENYDRRDGDINYKYFNADAEQLPLWKYGVTKGEPHLIDIIPFIAGDRYPLLDKKNPVRSGDPVYVLEVYVHQNIGPQKEMIICPSRNYNQQCSVCEDIASMVKDGKEYEDYSNIALKRRCVYNIVCYDSKKEEDKGVQIWEVSYKYSEKQLLLAARLPRGGGWIPYASPDTTGKSISFDVADDTYRTIEGIKLVDRNYEIPDEYLKSAFILDQIIIVKTYEEIKHMMQVNIGADSHFEERAESSRSLPQCFGISIDTLNDCDNCADYDACASETDKRVVTQPVSRRPMPSQQRTGNTGSTGRATRQEQDNEAKTERPFTRRRMKNDDIPY